MKKIVRFLDTNFDTLMLILINLAVFFYIFLAIAAPIAKFLGLDAFADLIYFLYSFLCHQKAERSFHIFGCKMAFCVRDLFIFTSLFTIGIISLIPKIKIQRISIGFLLLSTFPIILDGGIQFISEIFSIFWNTEAFYKSTNFSRFITGTFFGTGLGLFFLPVLRNTRKSENDSTSLIFFTNVFLSFLVYLVFKYVERVTFLSFIPARFIF